MTAPQPKLKKSEIKPTVRGVPYVYALLSKLRCYVWKYEEPKWNIQKQEHDWSKPARSPKTSRHRKIRYSEENFDKDVHLWGTFEEAYEAYERSQDELQGVGFLIEPDRLYEVDLRSESEYTHFELGRLIKVEESEKAFAIYCDFDDCRDPYTGEVHPWVREQIEKQDTYTEVSPSGKGIRTIGWGTRHPDSYTVFPKELTDGLQVEVYGGAVGKRHLITFTGVPLEGRRAVHMWSIQDWIDTVVPIKKNHQGTVTPEPLDLSEEELLQKMLSSHDKELIERFMDGDETLWEGEGARYESRSHADQGFLRKMAFWTRGDRERMRKITLSSRMRREKWNRKGYLDNLIEQGISYCGGNFYDPHNTGKVIEELYHLRMNTSWNSMNACHLLSGFLSLAYMYGRYIPGEGVYVYGSVRNLNLRSRIVNPDSKDHITVTQTWRVLEEMGYIKEIFKGGSPGRPNKASLYLIPEPTHTSTPSEYIHIDERQGGGERRGMSLSFVYVI